MIKVCTACGTSYDEQREEIKRCAICDDERQYVPATGQKWMPLERLLLTHSNKWQQHTATLFSLQTVPGFAINQRAFLLRTSQGNILWDCIANLDNATKAIISALGGIHAIAISHPHYYSTMQDWATAFNAPIYLHASDREWIMRSSPHIQLWHGDELEILPAVKLIRLGGHFAGGCVLHHSHNDGLLLSGDILQVTPGANAVSFMWSYPNMLPLSASTVSDIMLRLSPLKFEQLYGAFEHREILTNAQKKVLHSGEKYIACLQK
ncbi:MBL fold metallo-hydrolase (plasmid) [Pantoea sp. BRR-3P]|uniref:MBL fold metallo-hydrolase n=1 Tax=Pantoea sp. BRR-3P TaxID=3141541 RepID=UPI0031F4FCCE